MVLSNSIKSAEKKFSHSRTILVGDLNMNPFERGVVSANGLHAVMSQEIAEEKELVIQGKTYPFFYNPMWSMMGDVSPGAAGTYFYRNAEHTVYFWNTFDQVLVRQELLEYFAT